MPNPIQDTLSFGLPVPEIIPDYSTQNYLKEYFGYKKLLDKYTSEDDLRRFKYKTISDVFERAGVSSPFVIDKNDNLLADFNPEAKEDTINENDTPLQKALKTAKNKLIRNNGTLPSPDFLHRTMGKSTLWSIASEIKGDDLSELTNNIDITEKGIWYKDEKLEGLDSETAQFLNQFVRRTSGADMKLSFTDKLVELAVGMAWDIPLFWATGQVAGAITETSSVLSTLAKSESAFNRLLASSVNQSINFNLLGVPQAYKAARQEGVEGVFDTVWRNITVGTLAAGTGTAGELLFKHTPFVKSLLTARPILKQEIGAMSGSLGFGYLSSKLEGASDEDALATGLVFLATHVTSPNAYKRVIKENLLVKSAKANNIYSEVGNEVNPISYDPDYFTLQDGKLHKIDKKIFNDTGKVVHIKDAQPITYNETNSDNFKSILEIPNGHFLKFSELLYLERLRRNSEKTFKDLTKGKDKKWIKDNEDDLTMLADIVSNSVAGEEVNKLFGKWKIDFKDKDTYNKIVQLSEDYGISYKDVKSKIVSRIKEYFDNPEKFQWVELEGKSLLPERRKETLPAKIDAIVKDELEVISDPNRLLTEGSGKDRVFYTMPDGTTYPVTMNETGDIVLENGKIIDKKDVNEAKLTRRDKSPILIEGSPKSKEEEMLIKTEKKEVPQNVLVDKYGNPLKAPELDEQVGVVSSAERKATGLPEPIIKVNKEEPLIKVEESGTKKIPAEPIKTEEQKTETEVQLNDKEIEQKRIKTKVFLINKKIRKIFPKLKVSKLRARLSDIDLQDFDELLFEGVDSEVNNDIKKLVDKHNNEYDNITSYLYDLIGEIGTKENVDVDNLKIEDSAKDFIDVAYKIVKNLEKIHERRKNLKSLKPEEMTNHELTLRRKEIFDEVTERLKDKEMTTAEALWLLDSEKKVDKKTAELINEYRRLAKEQHSRPDAVDTKVRSMSMEDFFVDESQVKKGDILETKDIDKELKDNKKIKFADIHKKFKLPSFSKFIYTIADKLGIKFKYEELPEHVVAVYNSADRSITLNTIISKSKYTSKSNLNFTFVHEIVHSLLDRKVLGQQVKSEFEKELVRIKSILKKYWLEDKDRMIKEFEGSKFIDTLDVMLNFTSAPEELISYALTEPDVANYLNSIPAEVDYKRSDSKSYSLFDRLFDFIKTLIKKPSGIEDSKLDELMNITKEAILNSENKSIYGFGDIPNENVSKIGSRSKMLRSKTGFFNKKPFTIHLVRGNEFNEFNGVLSVNFPNDNGKPKPTLQMHRDTEGSNKNKPDLFTDPPLHPDISQDFIDEKVRRELDYTSKTHKSNILTPKFDNFKRMVKDGELWKRGKEKVKYYYNLNLVPSEMAERNKKFGVLYKLGQGMVNQGNYEFNRILRQKDGLAEWSAFRRAKKYNPEEFNHYLASWKTYRQLRYEGKINSLTYEEFADTFKLTDIEKDLLNRHQNFVKTTNALLRERWKKILFELDGNLSSHLTAEQKEEILGANYKEIVKEMKNDIKSHPEERAKIAEYLTEKIYPSSWDNIAYYNEVRPTDSKTYLINANIKKDSEFKGKVPDTVYTYAYTPEEANKLRNELDKQGYAIRMKKMSDIIKDKAYWDSLTTRQLLELVHKAEIPILELSDINQESNDNYERLKIENDTIQKLIDVIMKQSDKGAKIYEPHTIEKDFVPGMHYTADEYENQMNRLLGEAVYGTIKPYYLKQMNDYMAKWIAESNRSYEFYYGKGDLEKAISTRDMTKYALGYMNQIKSPERTWSDLIRGVAMTYHVGGIKPSFILMQAAQGFQTTLHQAIAKLDGDISGGMKTFNKASKESIDYGILLARIRRGENIEDLKLSQENKEKLLLLQDLDLMNKIGGVGMQELFGVGGDSEYYYQGGMKKVILGMNKAASKLGMAVERWTRIQSALTFYDIAKNKGLEGNDLFEYVMNQVDKTMGLWGKGGRAPILDSKDIVAKNHPFMQGLKKSFMTYKNFGYHNWSLYHDLVRNRQYSAFMTKAIAGVGLHGITKFPLLAGLFAIADLFTDEDIDYQMWEAADELDKIMPIPLGKFLHRGVGSFAGLDTRGMFGEDSPLVTDLWVNSWQNSWEAKMYDIGLGAPYNFSRDFIDGSVALTKELYRDYISDLPLTEKEHKILQRRYYKLSPVFVRNVIKAFDFTKDGIEVKGKQMITAPEFTSQDFIFKLLSFPIERESRAYLEFDSGVEAQYNKAERILEAGRQHRKDLVKQGVPLNIINEEMKKIAKTMQKARETKRKLANEVRRIKRFRKYNKK